MWFQTAAITGDLNDLMPGKQYVLKTNPTDPENSISYAAAEYILYMPFRNTSNGLPPTAEDVSTYVAVILDTQPNHEFYQLGMRWRQNGDNIIVNVTSPLIGGASRQTRISIVMNKASPFIFYGTPTISSAKFFDGNGNVIPSTQLPRLVGINL